MINPSETQKRRELFFSAEPPGQAGRAYDLLKGLDDLQVEPGSQANSLVINYSLLDYSLKGLENGLIREGFSFDDSLLHQLNRKLAHYGEEMQYHNLNTPELPVKSREREIFVRVYENHPHGDHDDTPQELREYK